MSEPKNNTEALNDKILEITITKDSVTNKACRSIREIQKLIHDSIKYFRELTQNKTLPDIKEIYNILQKWLEEEKNVENFIQEKQETGTNMIDILGFPIKYSKTQIQLENAIKLLNEKKKELNTQEFIDYIYKKSELYNDQNKPNLTLLNSDSSEYFYGNENCSAVGVIFRAIIHSMGLDVTDDKDNREKLSGLFCMAPYHTYKNKEILEELFSLSPLSFSSTGSLLFGTYQFGGSRTNSAIYNEKELFELLDKINPNYEDCVTWLLQLLEIPQEKINNTVSKRIKENPKEYQLLIKNSTELAEGDIIVTDGHCGIIIGILEEENGEEIIITAEANRELEKNDIKIEGIGFRDYTIEEFKQAGYKILKCDHQIEQGDDDDNNRTSIYNIIMQYDNYNETETTPLAGGYEDNSDNTIQG